MKQLLILLAIAACGSCAWSGGLRVRFGLGLDFFINMPQSVSAAVSEGWSQLPRPDNVLPSLLMYCHEDRIVCALYDDTEFVAGLQVAFPTDEFTEAVYDWEVQGFTQWTPADDGKVYWTIQQYFVSEEFLATSSEDRLASRDSNKVLQLDGIWVTGTDKELVKISTDGDDIASNSEFTEQACIPLMGRHYYYNMTTDLECSAKTLFPWFPLVASGELVGTGLIAYGQLPEDSDQDWFERPGSGAVKVIVPRGPECLYELADSPGLVTMHIYYIKYPWLLTCLFQ